MHDSIQEGRKDRFEGVNFVIQNILRLKKITGSYKISTRDRSDSSYGCEYPGNLPGCRRFQYNALWNQSCRLCICQWSGLDKSRNVVPGKVRYCKTLFRALMRWRRFCSYVVRNSSCLSNLSSSRLRALFPSVQQQGRNNQADGPSDSSVSLSQVLNMYPSMINGAFVVLFVERFGKTTDNIKVPERTSIRPGAHMEQVFRGKEIIVISPKGVNAHAILFGTDLIPPDQWCTLYQTGINTHCQMPGSAIRNEMSFTLNSIRIGISITRYAVTNYTTLLAAEHS